MAKAENKNKSKAKKPAVPAVPAAYILTFEANHHLNGDNRCVRWYNGHGVLDRRGLAEFRPDFYDIGTLERKEGAPDLMAATLEYWTDRGAKAQKVSEAKADEYRTKISLDPTGHLPKEEKTDEEPAESPDAPETPDVPPHEQPGVPEDPDEEPAGDPEDEIREDSEDPADEEDDNDGNPGADEEPKEE